MLLIFIAYVIYVDRKIWAAVQLPHGPECRRSLGALSNLRRHAEVRLQGTGHSRRRQQGVFLLAPFVMAMLALSAWAVIPMSEGWAIADLNVGILYIFAISSLSVYGIIRGAGRRTRNIRFFRRCARRRR